MNEQTSSPRPIRLGKYLSDAGVASRRRAEEIILAGRVLVNDEVINTLPAFVRPGVDQVMVDGSAIKTVRLEYFVVHKPKGVVCTNSDPSGRTRAIDLLPPGLPRLFAVGRLEMESSGLMLMTNDGELAQRISHPRHGIGKVYRAEVAGRAGPGLVDELKGGVWLAEGKTVPSDVRIVRASPTQSILEITMREGPNRQVRRLLARCGHPVRRLTRIGIGPIGLKGLPVGSSRRLFPEELSALRRTIASGGDGLTPREHREPAAPRVRPAAGREPARPRRPRPSEPARRERPGTPHPRATRQDRRPPRGKGFGRRTTGRATSSQSATKKHVGRRKRQG